LRLVVGPLDLSEGELWDLVALPYCNAGDGDGFKLSAATTESGLATPSWETGELPLSRYSGQARFDPYGRDRTAYSAVHGWAWRGDAGWTGGAGRNEPWLRIDFYIRSPRIPADWTEAAYFRAGNLVVAQAWQPSGHVEIGETHGYMAGSTRVRTAGKALRVTPQRQPKQGNFKLQFMTEVESATKSSELARVAGDGWPVFFVLDPDNDTTGHETTFFGPIEASDMAKRNYDVWDRVIKIQEML
jgi:hypothetical protein